MTTNDDSISSLTLMSNWVKTYTDCKDLKKNWMSNRVKTYVDCKDLFLFFPKKKCQTG